MKLRRSRGFAAPALAAALATVLLPRPSTAEDRPPDQDGTMTVTGRLLNADGKPVAGGRVALVAEAWCRTERPLGIYVHNGLPITFRTSGPFQSDGDGKFVATIAVGPSQPAWEVFVHATADGHGHDAVKLDKWARWQDVTIKLDREHAIRGRLIDTQGQPVACAVVRPIIASTMGTTRETLIPTEPVPPYASPLLPAVTTDDKGRFLLSGFGQSKVWLEVTHGRFATQRVNPQPSPRAEARDTPFSLVAARVVEGRVTDGPGGRPVVGACVVAVTGFDGVVQCLTNADGRYSLNPHPGDSASITVFPPDGQPYLVERKGVTFSQSARLETDFALRRGVMVRGRLTESPSGRPVAGALVLYRPRRAKNPHQRIGYEYFLEWYRSAFTSGVSATDGTFRIAVPPGPGHLFILGPTQDYVSVETSEGELEFGRPSRIRNYPDALIALDPKPGSGPLDVAATLRRGVTFRAKVQAPDGKPVDKFTVISRSYLPTGFYNWQAPWNVLEVHDGELALPGCDPEKGGTAWLFDPAHQLGLTLKFTGAEASGPPRTVRLQPCGSASVRAVNPRGEALKNQSVHLYAMFAPGDIMAATFLTDTDDHELEGDWGMWINYHYHHEWQRGTDDRGETTFQGLVPGLEYAIATFENFDPNRGQLKMEFRVKPGQALKLPDLRVGK